MDEFPETLPLGRERFVQEYLAKHYPQSFEEVAPTKTVFIRTYNALQSEEDKVLLVKKMTAREDLLREIVEDDLAKQSFKPFKVADEETLRGRLSRSCQGPREDLQRGLVPLRRAHLLKQDPDGALAAHRSLAGRASQAVVSKRLWGSPFRTFSRTALRTRSTTTRRCGG